MKSAKELHEGKKYNLLTVLDVFKDEKRSNKAICLCECGNKKELYLDNIVPTGNKRVTKSCGCLRASNTWSNKKIHNWKIYNIWRGFRARCNQKSHISYKWYGARGIDYYSMWDDYETFRDWALENGYENGLSIERVDVNKGYYPDNVIFIPLQDQAKNTRCTTVTIGGITKTRKEWCDIIGIGKAGLRYRLRQQKDINSLLMPPVTCESESRDEKELSKIISILDYSKGINYFDVTTNSVVEYGQRKMGGVANFREKT